MKRNQEKLPDIPVMILCGVTEILPHPMVLTGSQPMVRVSCPQPLETFGTNVTGTVKVQDVCRFISSERAVLIWSGINE